MRKIFYAILPLLMLSSCKPESPHKLYLFNKEINGVTVSNNPEEKMFCIEIKNKNNFLYENLQVAGKIIHIDSGEISFSDSDNKDIVLDGKLEYTFTTVLPKRNIYIRYSDSLNDLINTKNKEVILRIYHLEFIRPSSEQLLNENSNIETI